MIFISSKDISFKGFGLPKQKKILKVVLASDPNKSGSGFNLAAELQTQLALLPYLLKVPLLQREVGTPSPSPAPNDEALGF